VHWVTCSTTKLYHRDLVTKLVIYNLT